MATLKPPADRVAFIAADTTFQPPVKFTALRPVGLRIEIKDLPWPGMPDGDQMGIPARELAIGPQHLMTEDAEGSNPKDRGIVLGADPRSPQFEYVGSLRDILRGTKQPLPRSWSEKLTSASWYLDALNPVRWIRALVRKLQGNSAVEFKPQFLVGSDDPYERHFIDCEPVAPPKLGRPDKK
jgi:hypothetical protein